MILDESIGELFVSVGRFLKELKLYAVVIPREWIQEILRILCYFCLKDGYEATRTDTSLMPLQIFHLDTEPGEERGRVDLLFKSSFNLLGHALG